MELARIAEAINSIADQDEMLEAILEQLESIVDAEVGSIWLRRGNELECVVATGARREQIIGALMPIGRGIVGVVAETGRGARIADVRDAEDWVRNYLSEFEKPWRPMTVVERIRQEGLIQAVQEFPHHSMLAVPIRREERSLGVVQLLNKRSPKEGRWDGVFDAEDELKASTVANLTAVAIESAEYRQFQQQNLLESTIGRALHDLRSPVTHIQGAALTLERQLTDENLKTTLAIVSEGARQLGRVVETLLDGISLSHGRPIAMHWEWLNLRALAEQVTMRHRGKLNTFQFDGQSPLVLGDRGRLEQVFDNLFSNAVKASPVEALIGVRFETVDQANVRLSVSDAGPGLLEADRERIFEFLVRGEGLACISSLGIGLNSAKFCVERHEGRIWVESEGEGRGSCFCVLLPKIPPHGLFDLIDQRVKELLFGDPEKRQLGEEIYSHMGKVLEYALQIARAEGANLPVTEIAAILHDVGMVMGKFVDHQRLSAEFAREVLGEIPGLSEEFIAQVSESILRHSGGFVEGLLKRERGLEVVLPKPERLEELVLYNADGVEGCSPRAFYKVVTLRQTYLRDLWGEESLDQSFVSALSSVEHWLDELTLESAKELATIEAERTRQFSEMVIGRCTSLIEFEGRYREFMTG